MVIIPWDVLSESALRGIIDAFVLREGTDYGGRTFSLAQKRAEVLEQLRRGQAQVLFDPKTESTDIRQLPD